MFLILNPLLYAFSCGLRVIDSMLKKNINYQHRISPQLFGLLLPFIVLVVI